MQMQYSREILTAALESLELQKTRIDTKIGEVRQMLGAGGVRETGEATGAPKDSGRERRSLSPAAREAIAGAQRRRWAAFARKKRQAELDAEKQRLEKQAALKRAVKKVKLKLAKSRKPVKVAAKATKVAAKPVKDVKAKAKKAVIKAAPKPRKTVKRTVRKVNKSPLSQIADTPEQEQELETLAGVTEQAVAV